MSNEYDAQRDEYRVQADHVRIRRRTGRRTKGSTKKWFHLELSVGTKQQVCQRLDFCIQKADKIDGLFLRDAESRGYDDPHLDPGWSLQSPSTFISQAEARMRKRISLSPILIQIRKVQKRNGT